MLVGRYDGGYDELRPAAKVSDKYCWRGCEIARTVTAREMKRFLISRGFEEVEGGKGSHLKMRKGGKAVVFTYHGGKTELSPGVVSTILKEIGASKNDLFSKNRKARR